MVLRSGKQKRKLEVTQKLWVTQAITATLFLHSLSSFIVLHDECFMMNETNLNSLSKWRMSRCNCLDISTTSLLFLSWHYIEALDRYSQLLPRKQLQPFLSLNSRNGNYMLLPVWWRSDLLKLPAIFGQELHASPHIEHTPHIVLSIYIHIWNVLSIYGYVGYHEVLTEIWLFYWPQAV